MKHSVLKGDCQQEQTWRRALRVIEGAESLWQDLTFLIFPEGRLGGEALILVNTCPVGGSGRRVEPH